MADPTDKSNPASGPTASAAPGPGTGAAMPKKPPVYSHFFRLIGMPNFRFRLPSRNWMIFWSIIGSWSTAYWYDRREKTRIIQKWCDRVSHIATQPLSPNTMPRSVTIVLSAPPADGLLTAREHFHEYVKPILMAGGMDWDAIEGRKEGDVRAMVAERIREFRMRAGEPGEMPERDEKDEDKEIVRELRNQHGVTSQNMQACGGDIVIGRNTWKEYMRGLHEGWLGPLYPPKEQVEEKQEVDQAPKESIVVEDTQPETKTNIVETLSESLETVESSSPSIPAGTPDSSTPSEAAEETKPDVKKEEEKKKEKTRRKQPAPFNNPSDYSSAPMPSTITQRLGPSITVPQPHILGFLNTPIRMYRFLGQRYLADEIGKQVASAVLASHASYQQTEVQTPVSEDSPSANGSGESSLQWEQELLLKSEEAEWHKSVRKNAAKDKEEGKENVWVDPIVVDSRIATRMAKFIAPPEGGDSSFV